MLYAAQRYAEDRGFVCGNQADDPVDDRDQSQMTTPQLMRLLLPKSLASAGWDIVKSRRDVEGILFDDEDPPESLHPALRRR